MNNNEKIVLFMHIHNSCARDGSGLNLLIKTSNARKKRILLQTTINICKKIQGERDWKTIKNDGDRQIVGVLTISEINYLVVSLFCNLVQPD